MKIDLMKAPSTYLQEQAEQEEIRRESRLRRLARRYGLELKKSCYQWDAGYQLREEMVKCTGLMGNAYI
jgi:hypothetical protein